MAKFYGKISFVEIVETSPGIWEEQITERYYSGDLARNTRNLVASDNLNDNIKIANEISIISDPYGNQNFHSIRCVEFMGTKWKVDAVRVDYPRLILSIGGVYNV